MKFSKLLATIFVITLSNFGHCLNGGTSLSSSELAVNKYGVGLYTAENGAKCMCVLTMPGPLCRYMGGCGEFDVPAENPTVNVMGTVYNAVPHVKSPVDSCAGYDSNYTVFGFKADSTPPISIVAATLPASSLSLTPPVGTKCQILGFTTTTNNIPNKMEVLVSDFESCNSKTGNILNARRHFCSKILPPPQATPFQGGDYLTPTFCQKWTQPGKKMFWAISKDEEEEEEEPFIFVGFAFANIFTVSGGVTVTEVLLVHEVFQCPT